MQSWNGFVDSRTWPKSQIIFSLSIHVLFVLGSYWKWDVQVNFDLMTLNSPKQIMLTAIKIYVSFVTKYVGWQQVWRVAREPKDNTRFFIWHIFRESFWVGNVLNEVQSKIEEMVFFWQVLVNTVCLQKSITALRDGLHHSLSSVVILSHGTDVFVAVVNKSFPNLNGFRYRFTPILYSDPSLSRSVCFPYCFRNFS